MKKLLIGLLAFVTFGSNSFAWFKDVSSETYYQPAILWMQANGIIEGYGDGTFGPDECVKRGEFLKMMYETKGVQLEEGTTGFPDVPANAWFEKYVKTGLMSGAVKGYPDGTFKPERCVNRAEAIKMAVIEYKGNDLDRMVGEYASPYDVPYGGKEWYSLYLDHALSAYLVGTMHFDRFDVDYDGDGRLDESERFMNPRFNFKPGEAMTRKEVAKLLYNLEAAAGSGDYGYDSFSYAECRDGYKWVYSEFLPVGMCLADEFGEIVQTPTQVSPGCYVGEAAYLNGEGISVLMHTNDFALTCDHGAGNVIDINCLSKEKSVADLKRCFDSVAEKVYKLEKFKTLEEKPAYYAEYEYLVFGGDGKTDIARRFYLPLGDYEVLIIMDEGYDLEGLNAVLTLRGGGVNDGQ